MNKYAGKVAIVGNSVVKVTDSGGLEEIASCTTEVATLAAAKLLSDSDIYFHESRESVVRWITSFIK